VAELQAAAEAALAREAANEKADTD
jgi:hypothetical protein